MQFGALTAHIHLYSLEKPWGLGTYFRHIKSFAHTSQLGTVFWNCFLELTWNLWFVLENSSQLASVCKTFDFICTELHDSNMEFTAQFPLSNVHNQHDNHSRQLLELKQKWRLLNKGVVPLVPVMQCGRPSQLLSWRESHLVGICDNTVASC